MAWSRLPLARSGSGIAAIFASTALSPSAPGPGRAAPFSSWAYSFIAARSSSVNPLAFLMDVVVLLLADFCGMGQRIAPEVYTCTLTAQPSMHQGTAACQGFVMIGGYDGMFSAFTVVELVC